MNDKTSGGFFSFILDPLKALIYTFRVFSTFMKEARQVTFSDSEEESIDEQIKLKARKLLQAQVQNYGSKVITPRVEGQVKESLNNRFLELAQSEGHSLVQHKLEDLLKVYLKQFDFKKIGRETQDTLEGFLNEKLLQTAAPLEAEMPAVMTKKIESLLNDLLDGIGQKQIFEPSKDQIQRQLNEQLLELAGTQNNPDMAAKVQQLTTDFIDQLTREALTQETLDDILAQINKTGLAWSNDKGAALVNAKAIELFTQLVEKQKQEAIAETSISTLKEVLSRKVAEIGLTPGNKEVFTKAESLSTQIIQEMGTANIAEKSTAEVVAHVNQELLKFACDQSNEIVKTRLIGILQEMVNNMGPQSLYPETENAIKLSLNTRAVDLAQVPGNVEMISNAEALLKLYLKGSNKAEVVDQGSMASIKKALNEVIVDLMEQTGKIESEANRVFNEILENCGPTNIDPLIRMKIESVLYKVLVKQLAVYGNKELTDKALELIQEMAQNLPHESSVNDLIMGHKVRQPDTL